MLYKKLTPVEKRQLNRSIKIVTSLMGKRHRSDVDRFAIRARSRMVLRILGNANPSKIEVSNAKRIIVDIWPFKIRRLRKLVNGTRQQ